MMMTPVLMCFLKRFISATTIQRVGSKVSISEPKNCKSLSFGSHGLLQEIPWSWVMVSEQDVGIKCFVNNQIGFDAILKHRVDDFLVNEVDISGATVHLENLVADKEEDLLSPEVASADDTVAQFEEIAGKENAATFKSFVESCGSSQGSGPRTAGFSPTYILLKNVDSKEKRTAIHLFFKKQHPSLPALTTDTVKEKVSRDDGKAEVEVTSLRIMLKKHASKISTWEKRGNHNDTAWGGGKKKYVHFTLYKENMDNNVALSTISSFLKRNSKAFRTAGTKDKRGVTVQRVSGFKVSPVELASLNSRLFKIKVGDFQYSHENLYLGQLAGNEFQLVLRRIQGAQEQSVEAACHALQKTGFINYFGLQRFGIGTPTHKVGAILLQGRWEEASKLILQGCGNERPQDCDARKEFLEKWDKETLEKCYKNLSPGSISEMKLLEAYKRHGVKNHVAALRAIPRPMRTMYVHAYQSYLWNHAASLRFEKYGAESVVVGDLVLPPSVATTTPEQPSDEVIQDNDEANQGVWMTSSNRIDVVRIVSQDDVDAEKYSIEDVVLPVPGSGTRYPTHEAGQEVYDDLANADGVSLTTSSHSVGDFSIEKMKGDYRRVFQRVGDLGYELKWVDQYDEKTSETDLDRLVATNAPGSGWPEKGIKRKQTRDEIDAGNITKHQKVEHKDDDDDIYISEQETGGVKMKDVDEHGNTAEEIVHSVSGSGQKYLTLLLKFRLPSSGYATMLIRELMKQSSAKSEHKERSKNMEASIGPVSK